jgi:hypothetical protein
VFAVVVLLFAVAVLQSKTQVQKLHIIHKPMLKSKGFISLMAPFQAKVQVQRVYFILVWID